MVKYTPSNREVPGSNIARNFFFFFKFHKKCLRISFENVYGILFSCALPYEPRVKLLNNSNVVSLKFGFQAVSGPNFGSPGCGVGSIPARGEIFPKPKRHFIAQSLSCSPYHRPDMTEMLLKGTNSSKPVIRFGCAFFSECRYKALYALV